jgi:hypothetical protein
MLDGSAICILLNWNESDAKATLGEFLALAIYDADSEEYTPLAFLKWPDINQALLNSPPSILKWHKGTADANWSTAFEQVYVWPSSIFVHKGGFETTAYLPNEAKIFQLQEGMLAPSGIFAPLKENETPIEMPAGLKAWLFTSPLPHSPKN